MEQDDLTAKQNDYAIFLPAISGFYATYIGKQRNGGTYVDPARMPLGISDMEMMNWLNAQKALFPYKWSLYSGGHANLDLAKPDMSEDMIRDRDPNTLMLGDSGGFQIAKGLWEGEWRDPNSAPVQQKLKDLALRKQETRMNKRGKPVVVDLVKEYKAKLAAAQTKREAVLKWLDGIANYGMTLDIPTWVVTDKKAMAACGITTHPEAVDATKFNNEYFMQHRKGVVNGGVKILNVLQGANHKEADEWYDTMKDYCDPVKYPGKHFNGWSMGGQNMCDIHLILKRLVTLRHDNLLQQGIHDWMHFLGTSKLEWAVLLTDIQRSVRKYINPNFTISFDCASPFLATANGQVYHHIDLPQNGKWSYKMSPIADDKKYATDTRRYRDAVLQDGLVEHFDESPISQHLLMKDICIYKPGDLNKNGKEGKTSWDSFSYALLMGHNVWMHLESVQRANRNYDAGSWPRMMWYENGDGARFRDIVDAIFSTPDKEESMAIIEYYYNYWMDIIGTRGFKGKKTENAHAQFNELYEFDNIAVDKDIDDSVYLDQAALDKLEGIK